MSLGMTTRYQRLIPTRDAVAITRLTPAEYRTWQRSAARVGCTLSELIREAVRLHLRTLAEHRAREVPGTPGVSP